MSLLDAGAETVTVYPATVMTDAYGNRTQVPTAAGVEVTGCHVQPLGGDESNGQGQSGPAQYRLICRSAPLSAWAEVAWQGKRYDVVDQPRQWTKPTHLAHVTATIRAR